MKITEKEARKIANRSKEITEGYTELIVSIYPSGIETRLVGAGNWIAREEWDKPEKIYRISRPLTIREAKELPF